MKCGIAALKGIAMGWEEGLCPDVGRPLWMRIMVMMRMVVVVVMLVIMNYVTFCTAFGVYRATHDP